MQVYEAGLVGKAISRTAGGVKMAQDGTNPFGHFRHEVTFMSS